ncbi:hypothetical protein KIN20_028159 [Parelaphostrongylus tenuis]|uniref:Uncharacterized protein n=1 Tax=Parelaphostrongylus tenuis TaxID=148309 RepID=A0AAD5R0S5_PARTN|nr:hypothetical protein KIN20_028159 [Parelaphostrongylus tenuis]
MVLDERNSFESMKRFSHEVQTAYDSEEPLCLVGVSFLILLNYTLGTIAVNDRRLARPYLTFFHHSSFFRPL